MQDVNNAVDAPPGVPLLDLKAQYAQIEDEVLAALREVCAGQKFILDARVRELETQIAEYADCRYGIGVSSGTDALLVALMALGIGPGDEVITSPYTFFATGGAIARVGARPVFCDIDPDTYNLSPDSVDRFLLEQCETVAGRLIDRATGGVVRALMPVHLFGQAAAMDQLLPLARRYGLDLIEDAAQAIGAEDTYGRRAGSLGDIGCFSFFPSKNLGAFGDGGMCTTNNPELAERLRLLRTHGARPKYYHEVVGGNFRLDELQAAVLLVKLQHLDRWTGERQDNARDYGQLFAETGLAEQVSTPVERSGRHVWNQYVIRARDRDALRLHLTAAKVGTEIYYPVPLHVQQCFSHLGIDPEACPEALLAAQETLALPIYPELSTIQKRRVVEAIGGFYR